MKKDSQVAEANIIGRGGSVVFRIALWYPDLTTHLFSVCTPYRPVSKEYKPLEFYVKRGIFPNLSYQLHFAKGQIDNLTSRDQIRQLLNGMFGGIGPKGQQAFDAVNGVDVENLCYLGKTKLVDDKTLDYYADQYAKNGLVGSSRSRLTF